MPDNQTLVLLSGGLDLQSPTIASPKGSLRDCLNFEIGTEAGYSRIPGWMPADGSIMGPAVDDFLYVSVNFSDWSGDEFNYSEPLQIEITGSEFLGTREVFANCIGWIPPPPGGAGALMIAFVPTSFDEAFYLNIVTITNVNGLGSGASVGFGIGQPLRKVSDGELSPALYALYRNNIEMLHVGAIDRVLGEPNSPVDGVFTYKDTDYAIHDCAAFYFRAGRLGQTCEGHVINDNAAFARIGTILSVTVESGSWTAGDAAGYVLVYDENRGQNWTIPDGTALNLYSADGTVDLGTWALFDGTKSRLDLLGKTRALLYSANQQPAGDAKPVEPWSRRRLSRELGYTQVGASGSIGFGPQGDADYSIYEYSRLGLNQQNSQLQPVTTAYKFCDTPQQAATAWSALSAIQAQDGVNAVSGTRPYTTWIKAKGFDFSEIPQGSVITGLEVVIRRKANASAISTKDFAVKLVMPDGTLAGDKADRVTTYPTALTDAIYGGPTDTWGVQLSRELLNDPNFGVYFEAINSLVVALDSTQVDCIKARVTYIPATRLVYIRNASAGAPTDIEARVIHYTKDTGDPTTSDQSGTLTLWIGGPDPDAFGLRTEWQGTAAGKSRRIGIGEEIRTAPGGGGALLAKTTGEDLPTSFPCSAAIDGKSAKWQFELANFYADPDAQMVFGVNGTEYAVMYDEQYSVRIRTGRRQDLDTPRHIANHLNFLHFGFDSGDVITSATFRPLTVDPALGSQIRNVGEPITGLRTMNGQTLGVWTRLATRGYQGNTPLNYIPIVISPAIGAIEYTVTNLAGTPIWTSARGVESAATVSAYGDFQTDPLSLMVSSWLQDRVQFDSRIGLIDKRPVMAVAVRSKRQYRLYFRDGYVLTVTLFGATATPMCTIQRLERGKAVSPYNRSPVRHVFAGIRDDGKEALLCAFDRQNPIITNNGENNGAYPYLAILDVGHTFATLSIPAYFELNPIFPSIPNQCSKHQFTAVWANGLPGTQVTQYSINKQDIPFLNPTNGVTKTLQPDETVTYLPFPNYSMTFDTARYGPFLRLRYDVSSGEAESIRFTHLVLTSEPETLMRT